MIRELIKQRVPNIPDEILFQGKKRLSWVGAQALGSRDDDVISAWPFRQTNVGTETYCGLKPLLEKHNQIDLYYYETVKSVLYINCSEEVINAVALCGGLEQYLTLGE